MVYYLDTSALVKRYAREAGSAWVLDLCDASASHVIVVGLITKAELVAGLAAKQRSGTLPIAEFEAVERDIANDFLQQYQVVMVDRGTIDLAADLAKRCKLRGYDAVQLACALTLNSWLAALEVPALTFVTADRLLAQAATDEGLPIENPNLHT